MSSKEVTPSDHRRTKGRAPTNPARLFYLGASVLLLALMIIGFRHFYLHGRAYPGRELTPPIRTLIILHGVGMSAWMLLFLVQPFLIVVGNRRVHMLLGQFGAVLAAVIAFLGFRLGIESTRVNPPDLLLWGLSPRQFMIVPLASIVIFIVLVAIGVWQRKRPEVHRPMMLLSVLIAMAAAIDRIGAIRGLYSTTMWGTIFGPFFSILVIGLVLFGLKWLLTRSFDRWFAIGITGLVLASALIMQLATSGIWENIADFLLR